MNDVPSVKITSTVEALAVPTLVIWCVVLPPKVFESIEDELVKATIALLPETSPTRIAP